MMRIAETVKDAAKAAKTGNVIVYPTDTVYGIGCSFFANSAIDKIYEIKQKGKELPFSVAFSSLEQAQAYANIGPKEAEFIREKLKDSSQGYTFIVKKKPVMFLHSSFKSTIGIRIPDNEIVKQLTADAGPIITTSANISGKPAVSRFEDLDREMLDKVDIVIRGECRIGKASVIWDLTKEPYEIIRN
jgi:tRNA threonylcarbamoyl adenosine modification protein (Sua5/YciO/YrdC/YwlC family)